MKKILITGVISIMLVILLSGFAAAQNNGNDGENPEEEDDIAKNKYFVAIGALLAMGIAGIFSAFALGVTGASAVGVVSENQEKFGKSLVLQVMPMTQGIYGLVAAVLLMMGAGFIGGGSADLADNSVGPTAIAIGLVVGLTGLSAIPQGQISSASINAYARNEESFGKNLILSAMPETMAIFGLLVAILLMLGSGLM